MSFEEMKTTLGSDIPSYRTGQLFGWLHKNRVTSFAQMHNLPADMRSLLLTRFDLTVPIMNKMQVSQDGSTKILYTMQDGNAVETVVMQYHYGLSVCLSSQAGCSMGCVFCASATGKNRDLLASEMLGQLYNVTNQFGRVGHVVLMGVGEPLDNLDNVLRFCDLVCDARGYNLSGRSITLSTCGIVPGIQRLAQEKRQLTLAISLHAPDDERRSSIMPINRRYPLSELVDACRAYYQSTQRRITFEYAVIDGFNNRKGDAEKLKSLLRGMSAHINVIPVNPAKGSFRATRRQAEQFVETLIQCGQTATVRRTLGSDIDAACGQLRNRKMSEI